MCGKPVTEDEKEIPPAHRKLIWLTDRFPHRRSEADGFQLSPVIEASREANCRSCLQASTAAVQV